MLSLLRENITLIHPDKEFEDLLREKCTLEIPTRTGFERILSYEEHDTGLIVPRGCYLDILPTDSIVDMTTYYNVKCPIKVSLELRDYQKQAIRSVLNNRFGIVKIPPGGGKTVVGIGLACFLKQPTLFLVHTEVLFNQTIARIEKFVECKYVGRIRGKNFLLSDFITVAMVQSLKYPEFLKNYFSLVIIDECHHTPAVTFTDIVTKLNPRYMLGLTATPNRSDNLEPLMLLNIGPICYSMDFVDLCDLGYISKPEVNLIVYNKKVPNFNTKNIFSATISHLIQDKERTKMIVNNIKGSDCKTLVLSERVQHSEEIQSLLESVGYPSKLLVGQTESSKIIEDLTKGKILSIISTYKKIGEGFDLEDVNKIVFATPFKSRSKLEQGVGRVVRLSKRTPVIVDILDNGSSYCKQLYYRYRYPFYKKNKLIIKTYKES